MTILLKALFFYITVFFITLFGGIDVLSSVSAESRRSVRIYPHLSDPKDYPDFKYRGLDHPSRATFKNRMNFTSQRIYGRIAEKLERAYKALKDKELTWKIIRIEEEGFARMTEEDFEKLAVVIKKLKKEGFTFRVAGYKVFRHPEIWHQNYNLLLHKTNSYSGLMNKFLKIAGDAYLGFAFGESDAAYENSVGLSFRFPSSRDRKRQVLDYLQYFQHYSKNTGDRIFLHLNQSMWHLSSRDGNAPFIDAQFFYRAKTSSRVHLSFMRGVCRQYGIILGGSFSFGARKFPSTPNERALMKNPETKEEQEIRNKVLKQNREGKKINRVYGVYQLGLHTVRKIAYTLYLNNASGMEAERGNYVRGRFEQFFANKRNQTKKPFLRPIGEMFEAIDRFFLKNPDPGKAITPIAFITDFKSAWTPPFKNRGLATKDRFKILSSLDYDGHDFLTDNLFGMVYPGYEGVGFYENHRYFLPGTPYGDSNDVLANDVRGDILNRYGLAILVGDMGDSPYYFKKKFQAYAKQGGRVFVTGENARRLWPQWKIKNKTLIRKGSVISKQSSKKSFKENSDMMLYHIEAMPKAAKPLMMFKEKVVMFQLPVWEGIFDCFTSSLLG